MLYLNLLVTIFKENIIKLCLAFFLLMSFTYLQTNIKDIRKQISVRFGIQESAQGPYAFGVIENQVTADNVRRKLLGLPGIEYVQIVPTTDLSLKVNNFMQSTTADSHLKNKLDDVIRNQVGIKIMFNYTIEQKSIELILDFFKKITDHQTSVLGPVIDKRSMTIAATWVGPFLQKLDLIIFGLFAPMLILILMLMASSMKNTLYLINRFQRKKINMVLFPFLFSMILILPSMAYYLSMESLDVIHSIMFLLFLMLMTLALAGKSSWRIR